MKRSLAILLGVGVLTFTFVQCKTSGPDTTRTASKPKSSSAAPAPVISSPADAAQATIAASQDFVNSSDPCQGLDATTCSTLKDAASQTAAADPSTLAAQMTPDNMTTATNNINTPIDTTVVANSNTTSGSDVSTNTKTPSGNSSKTGEISAGGVLLALGVLAAAGFSYSAYKSAETKALLEKSKQTPIEVNMGQSSNPQRTGKYRIKNSKGSLVYEYETTSVKDWLRISDSEKGLRNEILNNVRGETSFQTELKNQKASLNFGSKTAKLGKAAIVGACLVPGFILSVVGGTQLADGTTGSTPAQTYLSTLDAIGQQVVNNYH